MKTPYAMAVEKLEAFYAAHCTEISLADTFYFFDALAKIREAAGK